MARVFGLTSLISMTLMAVMGANAANQPPGGQGQGQGQGRGGAGGGRPPIAALNACKALEADAACEFTDRGATQSGRCFTPGKGRPLACRPSAGASNSAFAPKTVVPLGPVRSTAGVKCDVSHKDSNPTLSIASEYEWTCRDEQRHLVANGIPDHAVGTFPNKGNPNRIAVQSIETSMPTAPILTGQATFVGGPGGAMVYAMNGVKFDPGTAGACDGDAGAPEDCDLGRGTGPWRIEALGQDVFDFGEDMNNAHVQPSGEYHYHGIPEGMLTDVGVSDENPKMLLVGWAGDGFPVYARYCYADYMDAQSPLRRCKGSYQLDTTPDVGRPSTDWVPMGSFGSDWKYRAGSGDLDVCNGRFGVTPEFPDGIYYYMATDDYPYFSRCLKGVLSAGAGQSLSPSYGRRP